MYLTILTETHPIIPITEEFIINIIKLIVILLLLFKFKSFLKDLLKRFSI